MTDTSSVQKLEAPSLADDLFKDQVILVTGANRGIGRSVALLCARHGAQVILCGRDVKGLEKIDDLIRADGGAPGTILPIDLLKATIDDYRGAANAVRENFGRLDGLAHIAGLLGDMSSIEHYPAITWHNVMHVNLSAPFLMTQALLPLLRETEGSSVVFASSSVGRKGRAHWGAYSVSKFGVEGLVQTLADECDGQPRVNAVNPGATRTLMRRSAFPAEDPTSLATPDDIAPVFAHLLSRAAGGIDGQSVNCQ